jgi:phosphoribosyl-AMP cyclohydrolase / phosphoribosyl-ATP pyrophosphohydrolase
MCDRCRQGRNQQQPLWHIYPPLLLWALEQAAHSAQLACDARCAAGGKPSWTARLLADPALLRSKVREEAGELCDAAEHSEGRERVASEAADLLYHAMVLLAAEGVPAVDVLRELRRRFGTSGVAEKAARRRGRAPPM